jgi:hypothetical protein
VSPVALRLAYWAPLGCFRSANRAAWLSIIGVNRFGAELEVTESVSAVVLGMHSNQKVLLVLFVQESRNAKDPGGVRGRVVAIELAS